MINRGWWNCLLACARILIASMRSTVDLPVAKPLDLPLITLEVEQREPNAIMREDLSVNHVCSSTSEVDLNSLNLFDLLILENVISFTAMVHQGCYLRGVPREG